MIRSQNVEQEYFVDLIRAFLNSADSPPIAPDDIQWDKFQQIVYRDPRCLQPLGPLIYKTDSLWELKAETAACAAPMRDQTLNTLEELPRLLKPLEKLGINTVVLKGPALAYSVYCCTELRYISDLDLLVRRDDIEKVCRVLEEAGYVSTTTGRSESYYEEHHFHLIYKNSDEIYVEVHWDLTVQSDFVKFDINELFASVRTIKAEKFEFSAFAPADLLLHIVSQSIPNFNSVGRLLDICLLIKSGALSDSNIAEKAHQCNLATPLWILLSLAMQVMGSTELKNARNSLRIGLVKQYCINSLPIRDKMFGSDPDATGIHRLLLLLCCPSLKEFWSRLVRFIVPNEEDMHILRLSSDDISSTEKLRLSIAGTFSVLKMFGYFIWCLASRPFRQT